MADYSILEQVKIRLRQFHVDENDIVVFDRKEENPLLNQLIEQAKKEIAIKRMYPDTYSEDDIAEDLKRFENNIVDLAVYDRSQAGEAYMASYSENGVSRSWKNREDLFFGVYPFVKVLLKVLCRFALSTSVIWRSRARRYMDTVLATYAGSFIRPSIFKESISFNSSIASMVFKSFVDRM